MNTNTLYGQAIANMQQTGERYGVSRFTLPNGDVVICSIKPAAGRSIVGKHMRTTYGLKPAAAEYAKPISRSKVIELLKI